MKRKGYIALTMAAIMSAGLLSGCGGSADPAASADTTAPAAGTSAPAAQSSDAASTDTGEKTVINIWSKDRHDATYVQEKVDAYNVSNTDNIEIVYSLYTDNYQQAIDMAIQSGELPDVLVYQDEAFNKYINSGQWADIYTMMDEEMKTYFADAIFNNYNDIDGKLYFLPTTGTTCRLFYNKEIFARVGVTEPPKTLEEMVEISRKITSELSGEGIYGFAQNMKSASSALNRSMIVALQRETGTDAGYNFAKGEYDFSPWQDQLLLWKELLADDSAFPGCESLDIDPLRTQFAAGKIGMYCSYSHAEPGVYQNQFPMESAKWDCAPIPTAGGKEVGVQYFSGTSAHMFNAQSPNLEKAFKAYKDIFTTEEYLVGYYEGGLGVSIIPSVIDKAKPSVDFQNKPWLLISEIDSILPKPPHKANAPGVVIEGEDMWKTCESVYYGNADAETALQDLSDRYNQAYQEGILNGLGKEIIIEGYDPMNPS